jgi:tRNA threonylcarbamoyl adenosine modification protein YeaZ
VLVMVVDTATAAVTAALARVGDEEVTLLAERVTVDARGAGELLAPQIAAVLAEGGAAVGDLAAVVAGVGPGPFTGLRAGLVTAAALGHALAVPVYGVCSLDAIGLHLPGRALVATDARRKEIYWAVYQDGRRIEGPDVARPDSVALDGIELTAGDGAEKYAAVLRPPTRPPTSPTSAPAGGAGALPGGAASTVSGGRTGAGPGGGSGAGMREVPRYPSALALAELAAERVRAKAPGETLTPLYLRRPDAVLPGERKPALQ